MAPAYDPEAIAITVCSQGCTFSRVQAAIDSAKSSDGDLITVMNAVHVEAGITVHKDVSVQGLGADRSIVQAHISADGAPNRVLLVPEGTAMRIRGMTFRHGHPNSYPRAADGIANFGHPTVERCVVRDNSANDGGGIFNQGTLTVVYSSISDNLAVRNGRGVYTRGAGKLVHCTIAHDRSSESGGGIYVRGTLTHSLPPGSPAIDVIPATACSLPGDQREEPRPIHISSGARVCDVGAFE